jgi:hypothetical protein
LREKDGSTCLLGCEHAISFLTLNSLSFIENFVINEGECTAGLDPADDVNKRGCLPPKGIAASPRFFLNAKS